MCNLHVLIKRFFGEAQDGRVGSGLFRFGNVSRGLFIVFVPRKGCVDLICIGLP